MVASNFNELFSFLAKLLTISYNLPDRRPEQVSRLGTTLFYKPEKSDGMYSHYESEDIIIVAVHGANDTTLSMLAVSQFLSPNTEQIEIQHFCDKYDDLIKEEKTVFLVGHSIGAYIIVSCAKRHQKKIRSFLFAPYVPRQFGDVYNDIRTKSYFKKFLYDNDWLANNMLVGNISDITDTLVLNPKTIKGYFNGHGLFNYRRPVDDINKDIKIFYN